MQAAGQAFAILFRGGGNSAVDSIVPSMLMSLSNDSKQAQQALEGLRVILSGSPTDFGSHASQIDEATMHSNLHEGFGIPGRSRRWVLPERNYLIGHRAPSSLNQVPATIHHRSAVILPRPSDITEQNLQLERTFRQAIYR